MITIGQWARCRQFLPTIHAEVVSSTRHPGAAPPSQTIISVPVQIAVYSKRRNRRVNGAGSCPTVCGWDCISLLCSQSENPCLIPPQTIISLARPHRLLSCPASRRVYSARGRPAVRARIVSPASVNIEVTVFTSAPNDHFAATPDRRVKRVGQKARLLVLVGVHAVRAGIVPRLLCSSRIGQPLVTPPQTIISLATPHRRVLRSTPRGH